MPRPESAAETARPSAPQPAARRGARVVAQNLSRQFGEHRALTNVDLEIEPGESFGLLGANGAGKTTFIRLVTGFLLPSAGEISVDGHSPTLEARAVQERLGFVAETSHLYPELKVAAFLRFAGGIRGLSGAGLDTAVTNALDRFDLVSVRKRRIGNLSKGFQQRVSLAQAFLHQPRLLIVDEPTSGLDPIQRVDVQDTLADLRGECTLLLCTHDLDEARVLTQRCAILYAGQLVAIGPTEEILAEGRNLDLFRGSVPRDAQAGPPS